MRRTGRDVQLTVDAVAGKRELADLMERLARPAPVVVAKEKTLADMHKEILARIGPAIRDIWPSSDAPIQDFDAVLGTTGIEIDVRYQATEDLGEIPVNMVQQSLRTKLKMPDLTLKAERIRPPQAAEEPRRPSGKPKRP